MLISNIWPGVNPSTVWDLPFDMWMLYAAAHDQHVEEAVPGG